MYGYEELGIDVSLILNNRSVIFFLGVLYISDRENYLEGKLIFNEFDFLLIWKLFLVLK